MVHQIAIDGPAASGKSTTAEEVAKKLGFSRLDSGLLYRAITYLVNSRFKESDLYSKEVKSFIEKLELNFVKGHLYHDGTDITEHLRTPAIDKSVGKIAKELYIRNKVHSLQHNIINNSKCGMVVDGRDIGTVVLPNAFLKIFITAKDTTRAERRVSQAGGNYTEILEDIKKRDSDDINREHGPLKAAPDAIVIENDRMTLEETITKIVEIYQNRLNKFN